MKTFYHITNSNTVWKIGNEITIGGVENNYWKSLADKGDTLELKGENHEVFKVVTAAYQEYAKLRHRPKIMEDYHFNILETLKETIETLGNSIKLNREIIFEYVRNEFYTGLPSRKNCIWLIPNQRNSLRFWYDILSCGHNKKVLKVEVEGEVHRASQNWLVGGTYSINEWNTNAHNYWKGESALNYDDEVLFEGRLKIIDEITLS